MDSVILTLPPALKQPFSHHPHHLTSPTYLHTSECFRFPHQSCSVCVPAHLHLLVARLSIVLTPELSSLLFCQHDHRAARWTAATPLDTFFCFICRPDLWPWLTCFAFLPVSDSCIWLQTCFFTQPLQKSHESWIYRVHTGLTPGNCDEQFYFFDIL